MLEHGNRDNEAYLGVGWPWLLGHLPGTERRGKRRCDSDKVAHSLLSKWAGLARPPTLWCLSGSLKDQAIQRGMAPLSTMQMSPRFVVIESEITLVKISAVAKSEERGRVVWGHWERTRWTLAGSFNVLCSSLFLPVHICDLVMTRPPLLKHQKKVAKRGDSFIIGPHLGWHSAVPREHNEKSPLRLLTNCAEFEKRSRGIKLHRSEKYQDFFPST